MMEAHVAYAKSNFQSPVYVSDRGDIMVDYDGAPIVATAREIAMNGGDHMRPLWSVRFAHMRGKTANFLAQGEWVLQV